MIIGINNYDNRYYLLVLMVIVCPGSTKSIMKLVRIQTLVAYGAGTFGCSPNPRGQHHHLQRHPGALRG